MMRTAGFMPIICLATCLSAAETAVDFEREVAPILERRCLECHAATEPKGGFSLVDRTAALMGGDGGTVIVPGKPDESTLLDYVTPSDAGKAEMPKNRDPLTAEQIATLRRWIEAGAPWPAGLPLRDLRFEDYRWWSLEPLARPAVPPAAAGDDVRNPIDAFIAAKLREQRLTPVGEADPAVLCRRLYFDLTGLPPTPEELETFVADGRPQAYGELVDNLLASPRYGERWARHWLDVAHFGETHGYDKDKPRLNAWPYRDYVIRALNDDKPYARFVQEQLAGDVLFPNTRDGVEALGFISAGPWDYIGHAEVPETKIDGKIARHLDRDDMVTNTLQTFCGLTVQCAQCHDHKFDPITQEDYYALQAVFAAVDRTERTYDVDPAVARRRSELQAERNRIAAARSEIERAVARKVGDALTRLDAEIAALKRPQPEKKSKSDAYGYHSAIARSDDATKWVQVDLGRATPIAAVVLHPCRDAFNNIGDGFGFPVRYKVELADDAEFRRGVVSIADFTDRDVSNPGVVAQSIAVDGHPARYVRVTAVKLAPRKSDYMFALAELNVVDAGGENAASGAVVASLDSIEAPPRWRRTNLTDGYYPGLGLGDAYELASLVARRQTIVEAATTDDERRRLAALAKQQAEADRAVAALPPPSTAYVGAVHTGSGNFRGTGGDGGRPRPIFLLARGNVQTPEREVGPGALSCITALSARFELTPEASEGERRAALARWITDPRNPLTWRVIVNRVWQYHFGRGLADSPNDLGRNGRLPTHPELLDWLAVQFRDGGGSLKALHRLIVTSAAYRRSCRERGPQNSERDKDNLYLWRANRRRLEAEELRDALLYVAGRLDATMYGPSFRDFVIDKPQHSPHYEYHLADPDDPRIHRRSIYRFLVRSQPQPFMATFDCADPSMQVDKRSESYSALQALALLNNGLTVTMAKHFAAKLAERGGTLDEQLARGFYEAVGRPPLDDERTALAAYADRHGLPAACRVLFNLNEFLFLD